MVDALNRYFVSIEFDATDGIPSREEVPGLWTYRKEWAQNPWTRCTFGSMSALAPTGEYMLSVGFPKHNKGPLTASQFESCLEESLRRLAFVDRHRDDPEAYARARHRLKERICKDLKVRRPAFFDVDLFTDEVLDGNMGLMDRFSGMFLQEDEKVRRLAAEVCGRYCQRRFGPGFQDSDQARFVGWGLRRLIQAPEEPVRYAAAVATFQLRGQPLPADQCRTQQIETAQQMWAEVPDGH